MLVVALQAVGSHGTEDGPDASDAQCSGQEPGVEQDLLVPTLQLVGHVMGVDVEIFKGESHHGQHGCACDYTDWVMASSCSKLFYTDSDSIQKAQNYKQPIHYSRNRFTHSFLKLFTSCVNIYSSYQRNEEKHTNRAPYSFLNRSLRTTQPAQGSGCWLLQSTG